MRRPTGQAARWIQQNGSADLKRLVKMRLDYVELYQEEVQHAFVRRVRQLAGERARAMGLRAPTVVTDCWPKQRSVRRPFIYMDGDTIYVDVEGGHRRC